MKKLLFIAAITAFSVGCNNDGNNEANDNNDDDTGSTMMRGVENVNGNIPDTMSLGAEPINNTDRDSLGTP